ncbi:MAG: hypothetical protein JWN61_2578 [Pseudonocardiales bacterium]|nr:hypothetical protein [Jatrophihabitantaceae bacterium]MCW2604443.1 hypothetical protein [Pseudonocardiales bacterium]
MGHIDDGLGDVAQLPVGRLRQVPQDGERLVGRYPALDAAVVLHNAHVFAASRALAEQMEQAGCPGPAAGWTAS